MMRYYPQLDGIVNSLLDQGFTVCYIDKDRDRRKFVRALEPESERLYVVAGDFYGTGLHYNILIIVNEHEYDPKLVKEWNNIPGVTGNKLPAIIRISL